MSIWSGRRFDNAFKNYSEIEEYDENGNRHIKVVYYGTYYQANLSDSSRKLHKALFAVLILLGLGLVITASAIDIPSNKVVYVTIFTALIVIVSLAILGFAYYYITSPTEMDHRHFVFNHKVFPRLTLTASILSTALCLSVLSSLIITHVSPSGLFFLSFVLSLFGAICFFSVFLIEIKTVYNMRNATEYDDNLAD